MSGKSDQRGGPSAVVSEGFGWLDQFLNVILHVKCFPDRITPSSPIYAEPVVSLDAGLRFELEFSKWDSAVGSSGAFDFLKNVQFSHRHSFQDCPLDML